MSKGTVLVTGATGFIAGHCIEELITHGYAVRGTVRDPATADVAHLREVAERTGGAFEVVRASLDADAGWAEAVAGCTAVWHVASPNPPSAPRTEDEVVRPAVDGTVRVLRAAAASGTVRRVVLTSSIDAIRHDHGTAGQVFTEEDWPDASGAGAYPKSKVLAERAAWAIAREHGLELVAVNPGLVLGPLQRPMHTTSAEVIRLLLSRGMPAVPRLGFAVVDVRDVARAHRLAMETPAAAGNRYIVAGEHRWMEEIAAVLAAEFGPQGYRVPTARMPRWLMWTVARFDRTIRLALGYVGVPALVSAEKAAGELGWTPRPAKESIVEMADSLIRHGIVRPGRPARNGPARQSVS
ncbi:NAD-dependent epimerase/dehydratase family protein [Dactylosporangium maewongense]|uniref:NAD-dependent epimerase/dehydratase family protein n=1 Tax=Dactylosporangium maewongense TaxID=634393 RepID=UPI0031CFAA81